MDDGHMPSRWRSPLGIFMLISGAIGVYYLLTEHLTHVTQAVPYLFLLACPLMHLFHGHGHHGHQGHQHNGQSQGTGQAERRQEP
ncbi:MAG: DUF2933 domain-containing protein [Burkholderiales bacterium]|nr:DUF2933 domain-containing protein [Burkholderiales bacterium]